MTRLHAIITVKSVNVHYITYCQPNRDSVYTKHRRPHSRCIILSIECILSDNKAISHSSYTKMIKTYNYLFVTTIHIQLYPSIFVCVNYYVPYQGNGDWVSAEITLQVSVYVDSLRENWPIGAPSVAEGRHHGYPDDAYRTELGTQN